MIIVNHINRKKEREREREREKEKSTKYISVVWSDNHDGHFNGSESISTIVKKSQFSFSMLKMDSTLIPMTQCRHWEREREKGRWGRGRAEIRIEGNRDVFPTNCKTTEQRERERV